MAVPCIAVVTGGHTFDVQGFTRLWRTYADALDVYPQHMDDFTASKPAVRASYDAVVFYSMYGDEPRDDGPWYAGKARSVLEAVGSTPQGLVILHHALLSYPDWPFWTGVQGMPVRRLEQYYPEQTVTTHIADPGHPITAGLSDWSMCDETYVMPGVPAEGNHVLLTTDHPRSLSTLAWVRQYHGARVFCYASGHDGRAWGDPNFQSVLLRGILWSANRLS